MGVLARAVWLVAAAISVLLAQSAAQNLASAPAAAGSPYTGFVRVSNGRFVDAACQEFLFSGWNSWRLLDAAANKFTPPGYSSGQDFIRGLLRKAAGLDLNVLRLFTTGDENGDAVLMSSPGVFNEYAFRGLDFILDEASKAGIKLIMVPLNFWKRNNGVPQFEEWCGSNKNNTIPRPDLDVRPSPLNESERLQTPYAWYTSPPCRQVYKDYLQAIVSRRNSINGLLYRDDPVILAWNMMNEPRCKYCGPGAVSSWFADIAEYLKSIDPNHMITTGEEGFFDEANPFSVYNPTDGNLWGGRTGQDFSADHSSPYVDFTVMHLWPDNWRSPPLDLQFGAAWIDAHMQASQRLGKPLILEEFGKNAQEQEILSVRDPWFQLVYSKVNDSLNTGGVLRGALFWQWDGYGNGPRLDGGSNIRENDTTFKDQIEPFSHRVGMVEEQLHRSAGGQVHGCIPIPFNGSTPAMPAASGNLSLSQVLGGMAVGTPTQGGQPTGGSKGPAGRKLRLI